MEIFGQYSDSFIFGSDSGSGDTHDTTTRNSYSDEEVMLASNHPKKRAGRSKFKETRHPVFRGIRKRDKNRWVCEVREPKKKSRIWLGTYPTAEMAARAHDVAALALRGHMACLNFADSAWRLPVPVSSTASDIQRAAAAAAEAFRPEGSDGASSDEVKHEILRKSSKNVEKLSIETENVLYMDEEAMFNMPGLLANMAEGLLISPPSCLRTSYSWDDMGISDVGDSLWSYSM